MHSGFAITIIVIGKKQYIPLFIIGFFLVTYSSRLAGISIFGLRAVLLYMQSQNTKGTQNG
ncbi:PTS sugar transporter subunit IIC [Escherichia coli]|uniref:PTS sugar transporter subunit IIC n=1 Tax=Escherichia coli TaxID=562 RepID=UPI003A96A393